MMAIGAEKSVSTILETAGVTVQYSFTLKRTAC